MAQTATRGASPLYRDIAERTQGELYIGVVGPVRAGKSTFISNFMQQLVLPLVPPGPRRERIVDELPQRGSGKTIMTTQPKFVPSDGAATVQLPDHASARVRMVDSVGYLVRGALGTQEGGDARMVSTPWSQQDMPFEEAAQLGTRKVMTDHATVGVVVTTDGTVAELPREAYVPAEEQVIRELKTLGKPFAVVLNSAQPESRQAKELQAAMSEKYDAPVTLLSAKEMTAEDVQGVMRDLLSAFPLREMRFALPEWVSALDDQHWLTQHIVSLVREAGAQIVRMRDAEKAQRAFAASEYADAPQLDQLEYGEGSARFSLPLKNGLFNQILSEQCGAEIESDGHLLRLLKELVSAKKEYDRVADALREAVDTGYGLVAPAMSDVTLYEPEVSRQAGRYGVRLRAKAPALHLIRSDIEAEVSPVLGTQEQTDEFAASLRDTYAQDPQALLQTNFFGRSLESLISEGLAGKLQRMPPDAQEKVRAALTRILNEGDGGMICILL
ncbi:MAG: stage IV sporulation protein A [Eubacteriales bacterium]|nr:stage IV sporulation protein A [Eubacteriales bacterium]